MEVQVEYKKVTRHLVRHLVGKDQLELKILEGNSTDAWIFLSLKVGHVLTIMRA